MSPDPRGAGLPAAHGFRALPRAATPFRLAVAGVLLLTALRVVALFATPLELYPDEAQYWLWSRTLEFGYFSKPPLVAWLIRLSTAIGGDAEPWIRLFAPLLHGAAALALFQAGRRLYDARTGLLASALYILMPAVQLSSGVMATDAPLLAFLAVALWAYAVLATDERAAAMDWAAAAFGGALALAALSKYAAAYAVGGALLHAIWSRDIRRRWTPRRLILTLGVGALLVAPNLLWNASHHFRTLAHTAANVDWNEPQARAPLLTSIGRNLADPRGFFGFLLAQFAVFGPVAFAAILLGCLVWVKRRREGWGLPADRLLLCFVAPPLILVIAEAAISRANANWAAPAYVAGSVLAAAWLLRFRATFWIACALALQSLAAALFLLAAVSAPVATVMHLDNSFKVARGWRETTAWIRGQAEAAARSGPVTAVAVDDRFLFNAAAYYGRDRPFAGPLRIWVRESQPRNQAETEAPLTPAEGARALMVDVWPRYRLEAERDFRQASPVRGTEIVLDKGARHVRKLTSFVGEDFAPRPRDPVTHLPPSA